MFAAMRHLCESDRARERIEKLIMMDMLVDMVNMWLQLESARWISGVVSSYNRAPRI